MGMKDVAVLKILSTAGRKGIRYDSECVKHVDGLALHGDCQDLIKDLILSKMTEIWTQINTMRECNLEGV